MAREHARIWLDINSDDDFESLPFDAQGLYTRVILTLDDLSYCGVATWRPRKLTAKAPDLTYPRILAAASALEVGRYCLFDIDTEEVLARSFIRRDELLRNPKYAAAVVRQYNGIASKALRAAVVTEIRRVREEHPEYSSWTAKDKTTDIGEALSKLMTKPSLDEVPYTNQIVVPITNGQAVHIGNPNSVSIGNTDAVGITNTQTGGLVSPDRSEFPSPSPSPSHPHPSGGYVTGERHQGVAPDPNAPYPNRCPEHATDPNPPDCGRCAEVRKADEALQRGLRDAAEAQRREFLAELDACDQCDEHGWALGPDGGATDNRCPQHDWSPAHA